MSSSENMTDQQLLRDGSLAFFGAITASVSHELNNVVSIVDQTAGLLGDLLLGSEKGRPITNERLAGIAGRLGAQSERGVGIIKRLNKFAHSVDEPRVEYEVNTILDNLVALINRFADLRRVSLEWHAADGPVSVIGNPFDMQQAVYLAVRWVLNNTPAGETVEFSALADAEGVRLVVQGPGGMQEAELNVSYLQLLMAHLGGTVSVNPSDGPRMVELTIPAVAPGGDNNQKDA